jgi:hypothetical protein
MDQKPYFAITTSNKKAAVWQNLEYLKATKEPFKNFLSVVSHLCGKIQTFVQQSRFKQLLSCLIR